MTTVFSYQRANSNEHIIFDLDPVNYRTSGANPDILTNRNATRNLNTSSYYSVLPYRYVVSNMDVVINFNKICDSSWIDSSCAYRVECANLYIVANHHRANMGDPVVVTVFVFFYAEARFSDYRVAFNRAMLANRHV